MSTEIIQINELMYDRGRGPELRNCRITVNDLFPYLMYDDYDDERMTKIWPVTLEEVRALRQYILDHYEEVKEVNRRVDERIARGMAEQADLFSGPEYEKSRKRLESVSESLSEFPTFWESLDQQPPAPSLGR